MRGWAPCRWKVGARNVSVCNFSFQSAFVRTGGFCWLLNKPYHSLTKPLISAFFRSPSSLGFSVGTELHVEKQAARITRLTCKSTPVLVKDGSSFLFSLDSRRAPAARCLGLSHGYWVSQLKLGALRSWESSFHFSVSPPLGLQTCRPLRMTPRSCPWTRFTIS